MSVLQRLKNLYKHSCRNCVFFEAYGIINEGEVDCNEIDEGDPEYFWDYDKVNDCKHFINKN